MSKRRRPWGSIFLGFAFVGWVVVTFAPALDATWWPLVRAFFDASLVGALADWFAVTALFRRPAGLPLPHTDLLVKKKDQLAEALPRFLAAFLEPEHLDPILEGLDYATLLEEKVDHETLMALLDDRLASQWGSQALTAGVGILTRELRANKPSLLGPVTELIKKSAGWKGLFVSRDNVDEVVEGLLTELDALRDDPSHPLRPILADAVREALARWATTNPPWGASAESRARFNAQAASVLILLWKRSQAAERITSALTFLLKQTDARVLSERIRDAVQGDLQAIRVNGALVGGLAGVLLHVLGRLILPS